MSMNGCVRLIYGVAIDRKDVPFDIYDDEFLPYMEGWENYDIRFIDCENQPLFIGVVLASWDKYDGDIDYQTFEFEIIKQNYENEILKFLTTNEIHGCDVKLIFCVEYS